MPPSATAITPVSLAMYRATVWPCADRLALVSHSHAPNTTSTPPHPLATSPQAITSSPQRHTASFAPLRCAQPVARANVRACASKEQPLSRRYPAASSLSCNAEAVQPSTPHAHPAWPLEPPPLPAIKPAPMTLSSPLALPQPLSLTRTSPTPAATLHRRRT